jgi:hypothetical protein
MTVATRPVCEAVTGARAGEWGFEPVTCTQSVGLVSFTDAVGTTHHACARFGHLASVTRRFGEPVWPGDLPVEHSHFDDRDANLVECPACEAAEARA